ncbi:hypothetical protein [Proteiniclasticum sp.]|uniref:hypothetical protein n=1 Tax=Proteiniclasticum sp. TaxID=2053595 RepID=UPI0025F3C1B5|nr:hypothetical protein [Proteiniclasticum sp.]
MKDYKEFDVAILNTGQQATIIEVYDNLHYLVEVRLDDYTYETYDISLEDIAG